MRAECRAAAAGYRFVLPRAPIAGRIGERLGRGVGSSLEFMDYRDYTPGDDVRHVDWRAFARTDQLRVRLYAEEVAPVLDVVVDTSASMVVTPTKERAVRDLLDALGYWLGRDGARGALRYHAAGRGGPIGDVASLAFTGEPDAALVPAGTTLRPRGLRLVLSDFLFAEDPAPALRRLAAGAARLWVVQILDPWELDPRGDDDGIAKTLVDAESGQQLDVTLDARTVDAYRERLGRLVANVEGTVRALRGAAFVQLVAGEPGAMFRHGLLPTGVVEPA